MARGKRNSTLTAGTPTFDLPLAAALTAVPVVIVVSLVPAQWLLPAVSMLAIGIAALAAAAGWLFGAGRERADVTIWDFAGACVLVGIAAGMLGDPQRVLEFFGAATASP